MVRLTPVGETLTSAKVSAEGRKDPGTATFTIRNMLTLRSSSPFDLLDCLEQQLSQQLHTAERVPAAEVHETPEAYDLVLELPGVDKDPISVNVELMG
jgi:HSP20 family molecular chaperone IbpA